jgi:hypothetical protein
MAHETFYGRTIDALDGGVLEMSGDLASGTLARDLEGLLGDLGPGQAARFMRDKQVNCRGQISSPMMGEPPRRLKKSGVGMPHLTCGTY